MKRWREIFVLHKNEQRLIAAIVVILILVELLKHL
jgi:hypothetical protein